jgi:hypothetical protein
MSYLKIAKPNHNALTATDPRDFYFNSDYNTLKLRKVISVTVQVTTADTTNYPTTNHSVSTAPPADVTYIPYYFSFITFNGLITGYNSVIDGLGGNALLYFDGTNFQPTVQYYPGGTSTITAVFLIYIFANPM